jgi:hypothetical protein
MLSTLPQSRNDVLAFRASGRLTHADYEEFQRRISQTLRVNDKIRVFIDLDDFHGWDLQAAWDELRLGLHEHGHFERCAIVGDRWWEHGLIDLAKLFWKVEYFDRSRRDEAWRWLTQPGEEPAPLAEGACGAIAGLVRRHPVASALCAVGLGVLLAGALRGALPGARA